jgi:hypothetical protein
MDRKNILIAIGAVIILMLGYLIFKDDISWYSKRNEILKRANIYNITKVAAACWDTIPDSNNINLHCTQTLSIYQPEINKWNNLIKGSRDINCSDFDNKNEANDFYQYLSGELAGGYYRMMVQNEELLLGKETNPLMIGKIMEDKTYNGNCHYDPYGLDTNHDCNACESLE